MTLREQSAENEAGPCEDFDEHACPVYCVDGCLSRVVPPAADHERAEMLAAADPGDIDDGDASRADGWDE